MARRTDARGALDMDRVQQDRQCAGANFRARVCYMKKMGKAHPKAAVRKAYFRAAKNP